MTDEQGNIVGVMMRDYDWILGMDVVDINGIPVGIMTEKRGVIKFFDVKIKHEPVEPNAVKSI